MNTYCTYFWRHLPLRQGLPSVAESPDETGKRGCEVRQEGREL
jgi:hypothetical protein